MHYPKDKLIKVFEIARSIFDAMANASKKFYSEKVMRQNDFVSEESEQQQFDSGPIHAIASDDFLPVIIFVTIRGGIGQSLWSQVEFINKYATRDQLSGEWGYYLTSLESCLAYVARLEPVKDYLKKLSEKGTREQKKSGTNKKSTEQGHVAESRETEKTIEREPETQPQEAEKTIEPEPETESQEAEKSIEREPETQSRETEKIIERESAARQFAS